jgi:hypothetical protein
MQAGACARRAEGPGSSSSRRLVGTRRVLGRINIHAAGRHALLLVVVLLRLLVMLVVRDTLAMAALALR